MTTLLRPVRGEAADYYFTYIDQVPPGDVLAIMEQQAAEAAELFRRVPDDRSRYRYAADKWSVRQVVSHINDTERVFTFRALWFARGFDLPLPGFDQDIGIRHAGADERDWETHIAEFEAIRRASIMLFRTMPADAWTRSGIASDNPFTVSSLAYITVGHVAHHARILRERYGLA
jgi:hypothetical protein